MPNSTVPAADTGSPTFSRRSALGKIGLGLASTASLASAAAVAAPATSISSDLTRLIEDHRAAMESLHRAQAAEDAAEQAYLAAKPAVPRFHDMYGAVSSGGDPGAFKQMDMSLGREICRKRALANLESKLRFARGMEDYASPKGMKRLRAAEMAVKKESLAAIDAYFDAADAARQSSGRAAAEAGWQRASEAEIAAMLTLCSYQCRTLAETRTRGSYLSDHLGTEELSSEQIEALLASSGAVG